MRVFITVGLGFGDEGKGTIVDALIRKFGGSLVVRYNGGPQAGHNVYTEDGKHHTFSQFGAGTFVPGCHTLLSQYMLVNPVSMKLEEEHLQAKGVADAYSRIFVDGRALIITPYHRALNRLRELARGTDRHGSCGMGIGDTVQHALYFPMEAIRCEDLYVPQVLIPKLMHTRARLQEMANQLQLPDKPEVFRELQTFHMDMQFLLDFYSSWPVRVRRQILDPYQVSQLIIRQKGIVFEGAQGVLIDQKHGFQPHTTWSDTTTRNAELILQEAEFRPAHKTVIGVSRTYMTRHGAGPFPTEGHFGGKICLTQDTNNPENPWQGKMRFGALDMPLLYYSMAAVSKVHPIDYIALTSCDAVSAPWPVCMDYDRNWFLTGNNNAVTPDAVTAALKTVIPKIQAFDTPNFTMLFGCPVGIMSRGPLPQDKLFSTQIEKVPA